MTFVGSELTCYGYDCHVFAISDENCGFAWSNEDKTILGIVDVDIGCDVEDEKRTVIAVIDIELLLIQTSNFFDLKIVITINKSIIIRIIFFAGSFRF